MAAKIVFFLLAVASNYYLHIDLDYDYDLDYNYDNNYN